MKPKSCSRVINRCQKKQQTELVKSISYGFQGNIFLSITQLGSFASVG